jgi:hypothetical protein
MAVLIGSMALRCWHPKIDRKSDYDLILTPSELDALASKHEITKLGRKSLLKAEGFKYELEPDDWQSNKMIMELPSPMNVEILGLDCKVATPEVLLSLKHSHRYLSNHWHKNIRDYHFLKKHAVLDEHLLNVSKIREEEQTRRSAGFSLNVSNDHFFKASQHAVGRIYEHDDLHRATCFYDEPLWAKCKPDDSKAYVSQKLFNELPFSDKVKMVQEEAFVIALERKIIPNDENPKKAFNYAVMRIGTNLTRGWFREFAVENYFEVMNCKVDFVKKFRDALESGTIRLKDGDS